MEAESTTLQLDDIVLAQADTNTNNTQSIKKKKNKKKNQETDNSSNSTDSSADDGTTTVTSTATGSDEVLSSADAVETTEETTTQSIEDAFNNIDVSNPSWDLFLAGFFVVGALLYGMSLGKDRIISIMVSIYMALAVVAALPDFVLNIKVNENYTLQITAFIAVFVVLFFMLSRQAVINSLAPTSQGKWWQVLLFSVLHVGLLVSVTMSFIPPEMLEKFSDLTLYIFTNEWTRFGWIVAPILAMIFVGRGEEE